MNHIEIDMITSKAIDNKKDFMYKKNRIPKFIYLDEYTYGAIMEDKSANMTYGVNPEIFIGLTMKIDNNRNLEIQ